MDDERYRTKRSAGLVCGAAALGYQLSTIDCKLDRKLARKLPHPNRQTPRIELSLTHRKQTAPTRSNRQIFGLSARAFLPSASHSTLATSHSFTLSVFCQGPLAPSCSVDNPARIVTLLALSVSCEGSVFREGRIASTCSGSAAAIEYGALQFEAKLRARRNT